MTVNINLLRAIADAKAAGQPVYVGAQDGLPLFQHQPPLISVDQSQKDPSDPNKVIASITDAGVAYLSNLSHSVHASTKSAHTTFAVQSGIVLPKSKRGGGGGGAPTKYPFETMNVGQFFFVANTDVSKGSAVKTLSSAAGSANQRFAEDVLDDHGEVKMKTVTRVKRDKKNKAIKDENGQNVKETVTIPERQPTKKFVVRPVAMGMKLSDSFTAPADGAVVARTE